MAYSYSIERILQILGPDAEMSGDFDGEVTGIAGLAEAEQGDLSFLGNPKYRPQVKDSKASVLLLPRDYEEGPENGQIHIRVASPTFALALICRDIEANLLPRPAPGIHPSAVVHPSAEVSSQASVGPLCSIGEGAFVGSAVLESHVSVGRHARIGDEAHLFQHVVVADYCEIGPRNRLLQGCVIGSDGYGYTFHEGAHRRLPQIGKVVTGADVDIGANSTVDRARFGSTVIGQGTKIDNLVQVAHNVRVGKHCLLVSQSGISGSAELGDGVIVAGKGGVAGHIKIGDGAIIAGGAGATRPVEAGAKVAGMPAEPFIFMNRIYALQRKLPELFKRFEALEKSVDSLRQADPSQ